MSDSDEEDTPYVPFGNRPEWSDVVPVPQDDGPSPVVPIAYSPQFSDTMNYFRAIIQSEEKSERALKLTEEVISINSANYTAWCYRRDVLRALNSDLEPELVYISKIGGKNPKNYQIWHHRMMIVQQLNDPSRELDFTAEMVKLDEKNYHAWAHRQWVVSTFSLWDGELAYINDLLEADMRNNSAWNYRFFVLSRWKGLTHDAIAKEIEYAFHYIRKAPNNLSPWAYLKGLILKEKYATFPQVKQTCLSMKDMYVSCAHVLSLLIDINEEENTSESLNTAIQYCGPLQERMDIIHAKYWKFRQHQLQEKLEKLTSK